MRSLLSALLLGLALTVAGTPPSPAAAACPVGTETCTVEFGKLRSDISTYAPSAGIRTSLLQRTGLAEQFFPTDPTRTASILLGVACETSALGRANRITAEGVTAILNDVGSIVDIPNDPCVPPNPI